MSFAKTWTDEDLEKLKKLKSDGTKNSEIARELGRTIESISRQFRRLKSPAKPRKSPAKAAVGKPKAKAILPPAPAPAPVPVPMPAPVLVPEPEVKTTPEPEKIRFLAPSFKRHVETCQWPIGTPRTPEFRFCEADLKPGSRYCAKHHAQAYVPARVKAS